MDELNDLKATVDRFVRATEERQRHNEILLDALLQSQLRLEQSQLESQAGQRKLADAVLLLLDSQRETRKGNKLFQQAMARYVQGADEWRESAAERLDTLEQKQA